MYATIRKYSPKPGAIDRKTLDEFKRRIEETFGPKVQEIRGFHGYFVVNAGKELLSISIFEDQEGATESTRRAAEFVKKDPLKDQIGSPEVFEGELLVSREAAVASR